ncbi:PAS domain S-box protein [Hymenobacter lucidus]|uniref:histidine kinase n=1 Tax=Hymenobacter lucidus TaxID=2880930 RepID=A0ABS8AXG0_9BACT|nr:PAS domain S-box protein [Hymenobacter lucidus]MCB2410491.1 PAS domain-containing protein [Hymenobacter lucidus]
MPSPTDYQALFEALPDIHLALAPTLTIVAASAGAAAVAGQSVEQLVGQEVARVFDDSPNPDAAAWGAVLRESVGRVRASRSADEVTAAGWQHRTWPVLDADNEVRYFLYRATPAPAAVAAPAFDSELTAGQHLHQILSQVPAHIATLLGPNHVYSFLNEKGNQLFGGKVQVGMPAAQAVPELVTNGYIKLIDEIYRTGEPFVLSEMPMEQPPAPDGSIATLYFDGVLRPLTDEQNRTQGILVFGIDVTERVLAKQRTAELMAEIREQNAQFRSMVESLPLFVYITDAEGKMLYINPQRYEFTGQQPDPEFRNWAESIHPDDQARLQADFARGREQRQAWSGEYRVRRHDGRYRWHLLRAVPMLRPDGAVSRWYGSSVDIDNQKQFQQQLEAKDEYLRQILRQTPAKIATLQGPEHRYVFFNERYHQILDGRAELGQRVADCLPELVQQELLPIFDHVYRTQETYVGHEQSLWLTPLGHSEPRQYFLNLTCQALHGADGMVQGLLIFMVDVTEKVLARQRTEALTDQLQHSDERLRRMTEALPVMTFINDATGRTEYTSPQWRHYAGYPAGTDVNEVWNELLHPDDRARAAAEYAAALAEKRGWNIEVRLRRHDGQYRWHLSHTVPADTVEGLKWYGSTVDIHEQKRLSQELAASTAHFSQLLEALPQLTWTGRPEDGHLTYTNRSFQEYTGAPAEALLGLGWTNFVHPDDQAVTAGGLPEIIRQGQAAQNEHRLRGADGNYRWFLANLLPLRNATGELTQWLGTNTDIDDQKRVQEQLRRKDQRLSQILSQAPAIVAAMEGPDHRYAFFNESHNALMDNRVVLGQPLAALLPEMADQGFVALLDQVYTTGETFVGHEVPLLPLGERAGQPGRFLDLTLQALRNEQGSIYGVLAFAVDATERVQARQNAGALAAEVSRRDVRLRRMTEALPAVSFICTADGAMEYLSPQWYYYTGQTLELNTRDIFTTLVHPDDQPVLRQGLREAFGAGRGWEFEYRLRRHDGQYRWQISRGVPEFDAQGQALRWYGTMVDNQEQRETQEQLRRSEEQFRFMAESIPQVVWTARPDGQLDYLNQRWTEWTGRSVEHSLQAGWAELVPPADADEVVDKYMTAIRSGADYEHESRLLTGQPGRYRWFLHRGRPLRDAAGTILKWFGTSTDIDDFKQVQQQLEARNAQLARTNADLDSFVYTASHDLRQPINNMAGIFEELTRTAYFRDPDAMKLITMFERALQQINQTIQDLSDVVQLQRRHAQVPTEEVALEPLTHEILHSMQEQVTMLGAEISLDFRAVPAVRYVRANLQSIVYNLLSNALKYAAPGRTPRVQIRSSLVEGVPVLTVADNGQGIDLERHGKELFQLFRRFHEHVEGSGMGLYLVNRMVQLNGGWLEVDSEVGVGSTFRVYIKP